MAVYKFFFNRIRIGSQILKNIMIYRQHPKDQISSVHCQDIPSSASGHSYRRIFVYTFCLISICLSLSDDPNAIKTLNIERV